jgi:hypothetical protein
VVQEEAAGYNINVNEVLDLVKIKVSISNLTIDQNIVVNGIPVQVVRKPIKTCTYLCVLPMVMCA